MTEDDKPVPEGMKRYTMLGMSIVGPEGMPEEFVASIIEGMVRGGALIFDPKTGKISPNPDLEEDKFHGMSVSMDEGFNVGSARILSDDEVKKDLGLDDLKTNKEDPIESRIKKIRKSRKP